MRFLLKSKIGQSQICQNLVFEHQNALSRSSGGVRTSSWPCFHVFRTLQVDWRRNIIDPETLESILDSASFFLHMKQNHRYRHSPNDFLWCDFDQTLQFIARSALYVRTPQVKSPKSVLLLLLSSSSFGL